jgi:dihydrofolate synthase/folylpolyglutamate synthase
MIEHHYPGRSLRLLFGLSKSKDLKGCLQLIAAQGSQFHLVEASNGRGISVNDLYFSLQELSIESSRLSVHESIPTAVQQARQEALKQEQILVICGSFFIMGQARQALGFTESFDAIDLNERHITLKMPSKRIS